MCSMLESRQLRFALLALPDSSLRFVRFGVFEVDLLSGELRKSGMKLKLGGQPFQILAILLEQPGEVVTREEFQKRLWPDTFVDVDHNLNTAINKIREALGDSSESPRFVETVPRRGYRFIAPSTVNGNAAVKGVPPVAENSLIRPEAAARTRILRTLALVAVLGLLGAAGLGIYRWREAPSSPPQRTLTRITFDDGLQIGATWSPDGRYIAYTSNRGGKSDIWVQQVSGGDPVQITKGTGENWQPEWSPDGKYIAYRSEEGEGGLYIVPALGGAALGRRISSFGYFPRWSPESSRILFHTSAFAEGNRIYVANLDGSPPREVLTEVLAHQLVISAAWHPDGKRISVWVWDYSDAPAPNFWTAPIEGGTIVKSEFPKELLKQIQEVAVGPGIAEWRVDFKFCWAPSGRAIYFERTFRGARNNWRMNVDPLTLQPTTVERLTTSPGLDAELSISADGSKLAFTGESQQIRAWAFPFDATYGRVTGPGQPVTSPGAEAWMMDLSRDGKKLSIAGNRGGRWEAWGMSISNGQDEPAAANDSNYNRDLPLWSPDGSRLAYIRTNRSTHEVQIVERSSESRNEDTLAAWNSPAGGVYDWSPDGRALLMSRLNEGTGRTEIWLLPVSARPHAETAARRITFDPKYNLYQPHFSPDGRWIVFEAVTNSPPVAESALYVVPAAGGTWTRITNGKQWDDKPRWSPDGKMIYFLSGRRGFFNLWGVRFDPVKGGRQGEPFPVTSFESRTMMIPKHIPSVEISFTKDRLVVPLAQVSGSIWVLDNVDR
jgi:Tol biopolymer transport system component/DNA-binding winged helix-turn-helix (wHTH) protein